MKRWNLLYFPFLLTLASVFFACVTPGKRFPASSGVISHVSDAEAIKQLRYNAGNPAYKNKDEHPLITAGRAIWYNAANGNEVFHTYLFQQKMGIAINWWKVLRSDRRRDRFAQWGITNDPTCCIPSGMEGDDSESSCAQKYPKMGTITAEQTYGFDYCPGDEVLWDYVGKPEKDWYAKEGGGDPACNSPIIKAADDYVEANGDFLLGQEGLFNLDKVQKLISENRNQDGSVNLTPIAKEMNKLKKRYISYTREDPCQLKFGHSTGALGFRKFPNPRFDAEKWKKVNLVEQTKGAKIKYSTDWSWEGFANRPDDGSVEPPYLIGMSCGACHISFDPSSPPEDPAEPHWANISGSVGNQYINISEVLASGMDPKSIENQMFAHARPGTSDTSAIPNDFVYNPGTINQIINFDQRPVFSDEVVERWYRVPQSTSGNGIYKDPQGDKWKFGTKRMPAHHILKGGEDSVGADLAVQRVYVNIGMCAEACWTNHLPDLRNLDPRTRTYDQTPFSVEQCRRDCPEWRALEDRVFDVGAFLLTRRPTSLKQSMATNKIGEAQEPVPEVEFEDKLRETFDTKGYWQDGKAMVKRGSELFSTQCAKCHSSSQHIRSGFKDFQDNDPHFSAPMSFNTSEGTSILPFGWNPSNIDGNQSTLYQEKVQLDWLGNENSTPVKTVETYLCRALHANHMRGHIWEEFGSNTLRGEDGGKNFHPNGITGLKEDLKNEGRGYYRNISLINVWAFAPFMHNNAVGLEVCGKPSNGDYIGDDPSLYLYNDPYGTQKNCEAFFDPSIEGRLDLFSKSVDRLLMPPTERPKKVLLTDREVHIPLGTPAFKELVNGRLVPAKLVIEKGTPVNLLSNWRLKRGIAGIVGALRHLKDYKKGKTAEMIQFWKDRGLTQDEAVKMSETVDRTFEKLHESNGKEYIRADKKRFINYLKESSSCFTMQDDSQLVDNKGHNFGTGMTDKEKVALKAFLATL